MNQSATRTNNRIQAIVIIVLFLLCWGCGKKSKFTTPTQSDTETDLIYTTPEGCKVYDIVKYGIRSRILICPGHLNGSISK